MNEKKLLETIEKTHKWTASAILEIRELIEKKNKYSQDGILEMKNTILNSVYLTISEMELLSLELED